MVSFSDASTSVTKSHPQNRHITYLSVTAVHRLVSIAVLVQGSTAIRSQRVKKNGGGRGGLLWRFEESPDGHSLRSYSPPEALR